MTGLNRAYLVKSKNVKIFWGLCKYWSKGQFLGHAKKPVFIRGCKDEWSKKMSKHKTVNRKFSHDKVLTVSPKTGKIGSGLN